MSVTAAALRQPIRARQHAARLRVVDDAALKRARRVQRMLCAIAAVVVVSMIATVGLHAVLAQSQVEIDRLRSDAATEQHRYEQLRLEVAQLSSPQQIVERATQLGMVAPTEAPTVVAVPDAPAASGPADDGTGTTLAESWPEVKPYLAARP